MLLSVIWCHRLASVTWVADGCFGSWIRKVTYVKGIFGNGTGACFDPCYEIRALQNEIYDIGTKILIVQCLNCLQTRLFCKSIIPEDSGITRRALSNASVKTRFKAFWDIFSKISMRPWIRRLPCFVCFFCPQRATKLRSFADDKIIKTPFHN